MVQTLRLILIGTAINDYFVTTPAYRDALDGKQIIFVGRKGSGKTANFEKLGSEFSTRGQTLVCKVQPTGYQLPSLIGLLEKYASQETKEYASEALWKYLIYTEIAREVATNALNRQSMSISAEEQAIIDFVASPDGHLDDFSVRLERCASEIAAGAASPNTTISEILHTGLLKDLKKHLGKALSGKRHIAVLIDDLDKAWDMRLGIQNLTEFLLVLLTHSERILSSLKRDIDNQAIKDVNLVIFLRTDIFQRVLDLAPEPDKISGVRLRWKPEELVNIIERRFVATHDYTVKPNDLWEKYFCKTVKGINTVDYITKQILPRPRDMVRFVDLSVRNAINRRHTLVEEADILDAEKEYSLSALNTVGVEGREVIDGIEDLLYLFSGSHPTLNDSEVAAHIEMSDIEKPVEEIIDQLLFLNFLGIETTSGRFQYPEDLQEMKRNKNIARRLAEKRNGVTRYRIHPAFCAFLETEERH